MSVTEVWADAFQGFPHLLVDEVLNPSCQGLEGDDRSFKSSLGWGKMSALHLLHYKVRVIGQVSTVSGIASSIRCGLATAG